MRRFQQAFAAAVLGDAAGPLRALAQQPAFALYRNTVLKGCVDALRANFPAVARLVGEEWFGDAALAYARAHPPADGRLLAYGDANFGAWLCEIPTAAQLPYLEGVAALDALWRAAHAAADAPVLPADALAADAPEELAARCLLPHPATRWAWFDSQPVVRIWMRNRTALHDDAPLPWEGDGLLLTRPQGEVQWQLLPRAGCALLAACAAGAPLGEAAQLALDTDPDADLAVLLAQLLRAGAFTTLEMEH